MTARPTIETCQSSVESENWDVGNSSFASNTSTSCADTVDTFVEFQPFKVSLLFDFSLHLPADPPSGTHRHNYVEDFQFGIVEGFVDVIYYNPNNSTGNSNVVKIMSILQSFENTICYMQNIQDCFYGPYVKLSTVQKRPVTSNAKLPMAWWLLAFFVLCSPLFLKFDLVLNIHVLAHDK